MRYVPVLALVLLLMLAEPVRAATCTPSAPARSWQSVGSLTTEPITVNGTYARLDLTVERQLCIMAKRTDGTLVSSGCTQQSGTTYIYGGGTYYMELMGSGAWSVTMTDLP